LYNRLILTFANVGIDMVKNKGRKVAKRPIQRRLTLLERGLAAGLARGGSNQYEIADHLNCTTKTVRELMKKVEKDEKLVDRPRSGRPRKTSSREDRAIKFASLKDRRLTAKAIAIKTSPNFAKNGVSVNTVKRRLREVGLNGRVPRKKPLLSAKNKKARYQWAKDHLDLTQEDWKKVIFSDETTPFTLFQWCGVPYVRRRVGEEFKEECLRHTVKFGGGKVQVWGCFNWDGAGPMYRVKGKMDGAQYRQILKTQLKQPQT